MNYREDTKPLKKSHVSKGILDGLSDLDIKCS